MKSLNFFLNKIESLKIRSQNLKNLKQDILLPAEIDLKKEQWDALDSQLSGMSNKLLNKLRASSDRFLSDTENPVIKKQLVQLLGELELEVTKCYEFYDTYMDLLTQRLCKPIGELLRGCDTIAMDGLSRGFLADISLQPIVYFDRGFGAKTCREGVDILRGVPNPMQFIAIPYSRLAEKYNLISIYHEVGHQTLVKLNMVVLLQEVINEKLAKAGAPVIISTLFANWVKELGPDFWAFCLTGMAQTCSLRDVLFLPQEQTTYVSTMQQHPPAYLRFLTSVHWCRHLWGRGDWDEWEKEWKEKYPLDKLDSITRNVLLTAEKFLPLIARIFCDTKYKKLDGKTILSLFTIEQLAPEKLKKLAAQAIDLNNGFQKLPLGVQLASFRLMRENRIFKQPAIDKTMTAWLKNISN
jgi:hypothetical protein